MIPTLVLTAGLGTRLAPLTDLAAKPAVPVGDRTLGERVLLWLAREGVRDAVLNLHHKPDTITRVIGDGDTLGLRVRYSWESEVLGSAGGPRHALDLLAGAPPDPATPILIVNGDTLTDVALAPVVTAHRASGADVTMVVIPNPAPDRYNGVVAGDDRIVRGFIPKGHREPSWHFVGIQIANAGVFAGLEDGRPAETVREVYRDLVATRPGRVRIFPVDAAFHDVGTPADYLETCRAFGATDPRGNVLWPGAAIDPAADVRDSIVAGVRLPATVSATHTIFTPAASGTGWTATPFSTLSANG